MLSSPRDLESESVLRVSNLNKQPPQHGGQLLAASERYSIPLADWLDLSTGINPDSYPIPDIPKKVFQQLPEVNEPEFILAVKTYYGCQHAVVASGSQRSIEAMPRLRVPSRVALPDVGYQEHAYHWQQQGHEIVFYDGFHPETAGNLIQSGVVDVVVLINPCNPTAASLPIALLQRWRQLLAERDGWLVIDEAFMDGAPEQSFASLSHLPGVVVLRSLGKFFGLAGIRIGFALTGKTLCKKLSQLIGPWAIAGPSQFIATKALQDLAWQRENRQRLQRNSQWMVESLVQGLNLETQQIYAADLFVSIVMVEKTAKTIAEQLAQSGILIRYWPLADHSEDKALLRFGLISETDIEARQRFKKALSKL